MKTYYDFIARSYDGLYKEEQLKKFTIIKEYITPKIFEWLLDIGSGTGLASYKFNCFKIGIEPSLEMIKRSRILSLLGRAEFLPFNDNSFDYIISLTSIQNFSDINKALNEIKRVSKKTATIIISCLKKSSKLPTIKKKIKKHFNILKEIEEDKDIIFVLTL